MDFTNSSQTPQTFWGEQRVSRWWEKNLSDAGQGLFMDPNTAITMATMPDALLTQQKQQEEDARQARGGFLQNIIGHMKEGAKVWDGALSNIPGWGVTKDVGKAVWYPVDKLASGAYWLYSNAVSQPLSTLLLQASKAELAKGGFWSGGLDVLSSGSQWADAYDKAEHISPAQAFFNYENTANASGHDTALNFLSTGNENLTKQEQDNINRTTERFLYDTDFWRDKQGWKYTVGTGAIDFMLSMGADPAYAATKVVSSAVKGGRSIKVAGEAEEKSRAISGVNMLADKIGSKIGQALAKTPEEAAESTKLNNFFEWADGKNAAEIAQHPIWGRGRRINPARYQISSVLANTKREDMPLIMRFAMGDNAAAKELATNSADTLVQIGKMQDNRVLVDSARLDPEFIGALATPTESKFPLLTEIPPKPVNGTPQQISGWEKTYGHLAQQQEAGKLALMGSQPKVKPIGSAANTLFADVLRAEEWKGAKLQEIDGQLGALQGQSQYFGNVLGSLPKSIEEFSPGESNIFGTVKSLYRQGPLALRSTEAAADKAVARMGAGKDYLAKGEAGFATRLLRNGFYTAPIRMVQSFGEKVPANFIDHNADDAHVRVAEMLKQVPGLGAEQRLSMIDKYVKAGDKVSRSKALDEIHSDVVEHMAGRVHGLDYQTAKAIDEMRKVGFQKVMFKLTGQHPNEQMFSAARINPEEGFTQRNRVDFVEDGEGYVIAPTAKTQLSYTDPLLPVKEFDRILKRNSSYLSTVGKWSMDRAGNAQTVLDSLNTVWKAATLLRPGYALRSMSEEQVAGAIKFGVMSTVLGAAKGGVNWALNRKQYLNAARGAGSYTSTVNPGKSIIKIMDDEGLKAANNLGLPTEKIRVNDAWPIVQGMLTEERNALNEVNKQIDKLKASKDYDPAELDDLMERATDHQTVVDEFTDYARAILQEAKDATGRRLGEGTFEHEGLTIPEAFSKEWENPIPREQITSAHAMETIFARAEGIHTGRVIKTGDWAPITPDAENHMQSWLDGLNKQFRQDDLYRIVAEDPTLKKAKAWVKTPAGKYHMSQLGPRARDTDGTIDAIKTTLDTYLPPGTGLQEKLARGEEIGEHELRAAIAEDDFPVVHGEELKVLTAKHSKNTAARIVDDWIEKGFKALATVPNDVMARQPIYLRAQEARMRDLVSQELSYRAEAGLDDTIDIDTMNKLLEKSDKLARKDISQVVYDPTRTTATEALRFISPFFSAHMDGLQRWGGLIAEKPQFTAQAAKVYNAPVAAGMVTDQMGRPVSQDGTVETEDENGNKSRKFVPLQDRVLTLRMPGETRNVKGVGRIKTGGFRMNLNSLNTILPGDPWWHPGVGPYAQIAGSAIAKKSPQFGDFLQWAKVIPYGPSKDWYDNVLPAYMQDAWNAFTAGDRSNEAWQEAWLAEYQRQVGEYANGGDPPDMKKVNENAKHFMFLDALTNWLMPARSSATPLTGTPYQFFIDQYKALMNTDPSTAKQKFLAQYPEYAVFSASLNKSMGIAASQSAENTAQKYKDLIAQDPDLASLIVGDVYNKGSFSNSVYRKQFDEEIGGQPVRQKITAQEAIQENEKSQGWQAYMQFMNMLDASLIRSGFRSYSEKGAEPFSMAKADFVDQMTQANPAWARDYGEVQMNQLPMRIEAMKKMVSDPKLMSDPMRSDLQVLRQYLEVRDVLQMQLRQRGMRKLSYDVAGIPSGDAQDIGMMLRQVQLGMINADTRFADLFHRYLENDDLS